VCISGGVVRRSKAPGGSELIAKESSRRRRISMGGGLTFGEQADTKGELSVIKTEMG